MENIKIKILAIDDNKDNLVVLGALVSDAFPEAVYLTADSGRKGFELCLSEVPDVILLDIVMPGMEGYEVCTKLKSDKKLNHIPVVMVTANRADKESRVKALEAGADAFLPKPVDESELRAQIKAMLRIKESEDLKKQEKQRLENMVLDRTEALEAELADRIKAENKLILSLDKITRNRQAIMNLMEDLKTEIKERKLVEINLKNERNLLRTLIDKLPATIYSMDEEGRKRFSNKADLEIIGFKSEDEVLGKTDLEMFPGEEGKRFYEDSMNVMSSGKPKVDVEEKFVDINGNTRYLNTCQYPLYDINNKISGLVGIGHDITERKKAEAKLQESEEKYRLLIENQGEGIAVVDLEENFVFSNPAAEQMFGVDMGDLVGRNLLDFISEDGKNEIRNETQKRTAGAKSTYEIDIIRPDGGKRTILNTATPQYDKEGKHTGTFGVFRDITDRKLMEQKVIESETYYRTLIDISPDGIVTCDLEGNISYGSIKALEIFGIPPDSEVIGTSILKWVSPDYSQSVMERILDILSGNIAPETREYKLRKYDKSVFWGELSSSPLTDKKGSPTGLLIVCRDISDRKKAESDLIRAKDKAEESDRLKTAFLHNISHEIRTPMNAIIGFSSLLNEPGVDAESQRSFLEIISNSSNHLLTIVSDIIEISNVEAGLLKLSQDEVNLNSMLNKLLTQFAPKAAEKGIEFSLENILPERILNIKTDANKLTQILTNLLSNAFKFTAQGKIAFGCKHKNDILEFYVSDTGIGISQNQHTLIFDRFCQVENSVSRQYEGTGLGLSIAKAYTELMGGRIWLNSEKGSGSVFYFTIPFIISCKIEISETLVYKNTKPDKTGKKTILVAEDEETNYMLIVELLASLNAELIHAVNGKEALEICESGKEIALVLMDIKMPVMDGYTATVEIRKILPDLPIIAITAFAYESDREKAISSGCTDYLSKPIRKALLIETINKYL